MTNHLNALFERYRSEGDVRALAKVFDDVAPQLFAVARHLAPRDEAEDLVQATFLSAIQRSAAFDASRPLMPWLCGVLALQAHKLRERKGRAVEVGGVEPLSADDPERIASARELSTAVDRAVRELPPMYAEVVRRHILEGANGPELARDLGLQPVNARVRLHRGLKLLRRALPLGFGGGAFAARSSLASLRSRILASAAKAAGEPLPAAVPFAAWAALGLIPIAIGIAAWRARSLHMKGAQAEFAASVRASDDGAARPEGELFTPSPSSQLDSAEVESAREAASSPSTHALLEQAALRGRFLLPNGAPAGGVDVALSGRPYVNSLGESPSWVGPPAVDSDADGRFEIAFAPPAGVRFELEAKLAGFAECSWSWNALATDQVVELGEVQLERGCRVVALVLDTQGHALSAGWSLSCDSPPPQAGNARQSVRTQGVADPATQTFVFDDLPPRKVQLQAQHPLDAFLDRVVEPRVDEPVGVELVYDGPDLARRIAIWVSTRPFHSSFVSANAIRVTRPGMAPHVPYQPPNRLTWIVDDLDPGEYTVEVTDPRFAPWLQSGVHPGEIVRAKLKGSASVALELREADGSTYGGSYSVRVRLLGVDTFPNDFELWKASDAPPTGGLIVGVVPGGMRWTVTPNGRAAQTLDVLALQAGEVRSVELVLADSLALEGRVISAQGAPLAGVDVQLTRGALAGNAVEASFASVNGVAIPPVDAHASTDAEGRFHFDGLAAGTWTVRAAWNASLHADRTVELAAGAAPIEIVAPTSGSLRGQLLVPAGAPLEDARLGLTYASGQLSIDTAKRDRAVLHDDWSYEFAALPPGPVGLTLMVKTNGSGVFQSIGSFEIVAGETRIEDIDLSSTFPGRLNAHVSVDGAPVDGGMLQVASTVDSYNSVGQEIGIDGRVLVGVSPPGASIVSFQTKDRSWCWTAPGTVVIAPGVETPFEVDIPTFSREFLVVDDASGAPLANAAFGWISAPESSIQELQGEYHTSRTLDAQGKLVLRAPATTLRFFDPNDADAHFVPPSVIWGPGSTLVVRHAP